MRVRVRVRVAYAPWVCVVCVRVRFAAAMSTNLLHACHVVRVSWSCVCWGGVCGGIAGVTKRGPSGALTALAIAASAPSSTLPPAGPSITLHICGASVVLEREGLHVVGPDDLCPPIAAAGVFQVLHLLGRVSDGEGEKKGDATGIPTSTAMSFTCGGKGSGGEGGGACKCGWMWEGCEAGPTRLLTPPPRPDTHPHLHTSHLHCVVLLCGPKLL